jgi:hypothetical protein
VVWSATDKGSKMPVDAQPAEDGNLIIVGSETQNGRRVPKVRFVAKTAATTAPRFTSHFATCPNADQHRKGRAR